MPSNWFFLVQMKSRKKSGIFKIWSLTSPTPSSPKFSKILDVIFYQPFSKKKTWHVSTTCNFVFTLIQKYEILLFIFENSIWDYSIDFVPGYSEYKNITEGVDSNKEETHIDSFNSQTNERDKSEIETPPHQWEDDNGNNFTIQNERIKNPVHTMISPISTFFEKPVHLPGTNSFTCVCL